jgi:RNA polymerase sigma factor (TIGR02999 family)
LAASEPTIDLIKSAAEGNQRSAEELVPLLYAELRRLAEARLRRQPGHSVTPTTLIHEAFIRLVGKDPLVTYDQRHFFFAASRAMLDILVERARAALSQKRGGGKPHVALDEFEVASETPPQNLLHLQEAMDRLEGDDPEAHQIVMLKFFGGLTMEEISQAMSIPRRTLDRHWQYARARLHRDLSE